MTNAAKMKAEPEPKQVRVRANLAVLGMTRNAEATITLTPMVQGALDDGKLSLVDEPEPKTRKRAGGNGSV